LKDNATAYVEHDPVSGEALMLRTSSGMQSLYVYDGTGNPTALFTSGAYTAFAYDPYGVPTLTAKLRQGRTVRSAGSSITSQ
jgi:hypothetical protein